MEVRYRQIEEHTILPEGPCYGKYVRCIQCELPMQFVTWTPYPDPSIRYIAPAQWRCWACNWENARGSQPDIEYSDFIQEPAFWTRAGLKKEVDNGGLMGVDHMTPEEYAEFADSRNRYISEHYRK